MTSYRAEVFSKHIARIEQVSADCPKGCPVILVTMDTGRAWRIHDDGSFDGHPAWVDPNELRQVDKMDGASLLLGTP